MCTSTSCSPPARRLCGRYCIEHLVGLQLRAKIVREVSAKRPFAAWHRSRRGLCAPRIKSTEGKVGFVVLRAGGGARFVPCMAVRSREELIDPHDNADRFPLRRRFPHRAVETRVVPALCPALPDRSTAVLPTVLPLRRARGAEGRLAAQGPTSHFHYLVKIQFPNAESCSGILKGEWLGFEKSTNPSAIEPLLTNETSKTNSSVPRMTDPCVVASCFTEEFQCVFLFLTIHFPTFLIQPANRSVMLAVLQRDLNASCSPRCRVTPRLTLRNTSVAPLILCFRSDEMFTLWWQVYSPSHPRRANQSRYKIGTFRPGCAAERRFLRESLSGDGRERSGTGGSGFCDSRSHTGRCRAGGCAVTAPSAAHKGSARPLTDPPPLPSGQPQGPSPGLREESGRHCAARGRALSLHLFLLLKAARGHGGPFPVVVEGRRGRTRAEPGEP